MKPIPNPYRTGQCFFCGHDNPIGLKLTFYETETEPREVVLHWKASPTFSGFGKILHGGIQSGLFDEIMGWATVQFTQEAGVTTGLQIQFLKPVYVGQEIEVRCRIESQGGPKIHLAAEIRNEVGEICTRATGTYLLMDGEKFDHLVDNS
ncbi:MAG: PaaI family thioesterase [Desulfomonilaceae bacterium]